MKSNIPQPQPQTEDNHSYKQVTFKVRPEVYVQVCKMCERRNIGFYRLGQMMLDCIFRAMSDKHNLTPDMQKMIRIFEYMDGWQSTLNLTDPGVRLAIREAIYFLYDKDGKMKGVRAVHIKSPFHGVWEQNYNTQDMLDNFIRLVFPHRYPQLMAIAHELGCNSLLELLDYVADFFAKIEDEKEIARTFEDAARAENGKEIRYGDRTKRKMRRSMENMYEQYERERAQNNGNDNENEKDNDYND